MTRECELIADDLAAYAAGSLDAAEVGRVESHVGGCAFCQNELREYRMVMNLLPLGLPAAKPGSADRAALQAALRVTTPPARQQVKRRWSLSLPRRPVVWGTVLLLLLFVGGWLLGPWTPLVPGEVVKQLAGSDNAPGAVGTLVIESGGEAYLSVVNMPPSEPERSYQLWFVRTDSTRHSGAVFRVDATGTATVPVDVPADMSNLRRVGVSEEPLQGSVSPTGRGMMGTNW